MDEAEFRRALLARVLEAAGQNHTGAGEGPWSAHAPWTNPMRARLRDLGVRLGRQGLRFDVHKGAERLENLLEHADGFASTMNALADESSRDLMLDLLARRVAGDAHVPLPITPARFQRLRERMRRHRVGSERLPGPTGHPLSLLSYRGIRFWGSPAQLVAFELGQYEPARPGEVVVDGGAGFGENSLMYAKQVGPGGRVVAVELDDTNRRMIARNLELNPELAGRITVCAGALWDEEGESVTYRPHGGESTVGAGEGRARTLTIDGLKLSRVDRIKLDVEGAEAAALRGAREMIRRDRPRLAISAYHRLDDLARLPALVRAIEPAYRFTLDHFTPGLAETVLLGRARGS